jgi:diazepam-binding inhibitor (GABA receptor modulating acyl-CoA-binding protein)
MSTNSKEFLIAAETVKQLTQSPSNDELQTLYGLYKQATIGDINIEKPGFLNFRDVKKWESWNSYKGTTVFDAEVKYILYVNDLIQKYGVN